MFKKTSKQLSILDPIYYLPEAVKKKLMTSWAHVFRTEILGHIPEEAFAHLYSDGTGRPNFPVAILAGLSFVKELHDLTDAQMFRAFDFDLEVQYALGVTPGQFTLAPRTMYYFRARVAADPAVQHTFTTLTDHMSQRLGVRTDVQRLDSTQVSSNIVHLSRLGLFVRTIEGFLTKLQTAHPDRVNALPAALRERYLDRSGYFSDAKGSQSRRRLEQAAQDVALVIDRFAADEPVAAMASFALVVRLFEEQCEVDASQGDPIPVLKDPQQIAADSLQAPSDPEATYSKHKGKGYQVQLGETCHADNETELVVHVAVEGAHESDHNALVPYLEATAERGVGPQSVFADTVYNSGRNLVAAAERGVELMAPTPGTVDPDDLTLAHFDLAPEGLAVRRCPQGHAPVTQKTTRTAQVVGFNPPICQVCDWRDHCPAGRNHAKLRFTLEDYALALSRAREDTVEFKQRYRIRSGIEATNSALKTAHGFGKLWARGKARVSFAVFMKVLALNVKRYARVRCAQMAAKRREMSLEGRASSVFARFPLVPGAFRPASWPGRSFQSTERVAGLISLSIAA